MQRHLRHVGIASLLVGMLCSPLNGYAQPVEIRSSWAVPGQILQVWSATPGVTKHEGKSYVLKDIYLRSSSVKVTAMSADQLDVALLSPGIVNTAITNAGMKDLRIIADETIDGYEDYLTVPFVVLKDSPIKSPADMKGKTFATLAVGSGVDLAAKNMLARHGLLAPRDYNVIEVAPPNMKAMLLDRKADLVVGFPPFLYEPDYQDKIRTLFTSKDSYGIASSTTFMVAREGYIKKNRAALVDFLEDYLRLVRWYLDPANRKKAMQILSEATKVPAPVLDSYALTKKDSYRPPDEVPDLVANQRLIQVQKELGFAKEEAKLVDYGDLSLIKEAVERLK